MDIDTRVFLLENAIEKIELYLFDCHNARTLDEILERIDILREKESSYDNVQRKLKKIRFD